jgi:hypothetical protein
MTVQDLLTALQALPRDAELPAFEAHHASDPTSNTPDVVDMLNHWHQYITDWVFGRVFGAMSSDRATWLTSRATPPSEVRQAG